MMTSHDFSPPAGACRQPVRGRPVAPLITRRCCTLLSELDAGGRRGGLPYPNDEPHVLYSPGVPVRIGLPRLLER